MREDTTALVILRALQVGLTLDDLNELTVGDVMDILVERLNDEVEYPRKATKADFERF